MPHTIRSTRGKDKLVDDDQYMYDLDRSSKNGQTQYWKCERRNVCKARCHTTSESGTIIILKKLHDHTHPSTATHVNVREAVAGMKEVASQSRMATREVIATASQSMSPAAKASMTSINTLSRKIRRWRAEEESAPPVPTSRTGYTIPDEYRKLADDKNFLQYDSGEHDSDRILVFASDEGILSLPMKFGMSDKRRLMINQGQTMQWKVFTMQCNHLSLKVTRRCGSCLEP